MITQAEPKLFAQIKAKVVQLGYSYSTARVYVHWARRFYEFHRFKDASGQWQWKYPHELAEPDVERWLSHLANVEHVAPNTQLQAFNAILFLYKRILGRPLVGLNADRAKRPQQIPEILSVEEVEALFDHLHGIHLLKAQLLYGAGLRIGECLALRVQNIDFNRGQIFIRGGKGMKDRLTQLPKCVIPELKRQIVVAESWCEFDRARGNYGVSLPFALGRKYPRASLSPGYYFVFCSDNLSRDPLRPELPLMRHHMHPDGVSKAIRRAAQRAGIRKHVKPHLLRHSFCSHSLDDGAPIHDIAKLMGHTSIATTQIYSHCRKDGPTSRISPADRLNERLANPKPPRNQLKVVRA